MAASDGQVLCAAARWAPGGRPIGEVVRERGGGGGDGDGPALPLPLPGLLKIVRGSCGGLGVPSLPHPTLQPSVMLVSAGRRRQIIAQAVKLRAGRGPVAVGPRLSIPETYAGWFELLSEDGRAGRCVESVAELSRRPCPCLVREPLRAILSRPTGDPNNPLLADGSRTLAVGETISPADEVSLPGGSNHPRGRYLTCATGRGDTVLLSLEQRGRFSPLAKEHNISGAHSARTLLAKRLPLTVRLLHGSPPRGLKSASHFTPELRLLAAYEEEQVFAYPLQKETANLVSVPLSASLKVLRARNEDDLRAQPEFARLAEKCTRLLADVADRIHVLDGKVTDNKTWKNVPFLRRSASSDSANLNMSPRARGGSGGRYQDGENRAPAAPLSMPLATAASSPRLSAAATTPDEYDEIDQIYDYVRGFAPLPKSMSMGSHGPSPNAPSGSSSSQSPPASPPLTLTPAHPAPSPAPPSVPPSIPPSPTKPEPPPIETIPTKKTGSKAYVAAQAQLQHSSHQHPPHHVNAHVPQVPVKAEKRSRHKDKQERSHGHAQGRLYVKHGAGGGGGGGGGHAGGQLSRSGSRAHLPHAHAHAHASIAPLGSSVRYKSLSNIHGAMDLDAGAFVAAGAGAGVGAGVGTLDSSHSGGRTSGDSGPGNKLPEKRSRKLSRPRSLTNLVWEVRGAPPPTKLEPGVHQQPYRSKLSISGHKRLGTLYL